MVCVTLMLREREGRKIRRIGPILRRLGTKEPFGYYFLATQDKNRHRGAPSFDDGISVAVHDECTYTSTDSVKHSRFFIGVLLRCIPMDC